MDPQSTVTLHTGRTMPIMGLGTWQLTDDTAGTIEDALHMGYSMMDTSGDYGTQPGIGEGLRRSGINRDKVYIVTKVEEDENAYEATQKNLDELRISHVDLILVHRPPLTGVGEDLWEGLVRAKEDGLTRDIGVSNYSIDQMDALIDVTGEVPVVNQVEWSPFGHSEEMYRYCEMHNIVIQAYSPLTRAERLDDVILTEIARRYEKTPAQILLRWNIQYGTTPIPKANKRTHLQENLDIFDFELFGEDMASLQHLNEHYSALGRTLMYL